MCFPCNIRVAAKNHPSLHDSQKVNSHHNAKESTIKANSIIRAYYQSSNENGYPSWSLFPKLLAVLPIVAAAKRAYKFPHSDNSIWQENDMELNC
jgi:hypothetical protein